MSKKAIKKVAVIGPEGTGKSSLCAQLAEHYQTFWCPEFARQYLLTHGTSYEYDDLLTIAKGQVALEEEFMSMVNGDSSMKESENTNLLNNPPGTPQPGNYRDTIQHSPFRIHHSPLTTHHSPLFIDTEMYVMKVWCEFVFEKCHRFILDTIVERQYDLYLLCNTDLPWVRDELREYPDLKTRQRLYNIYEDIMINQTVPWVKIDGSTNERLEKAISAVNKIL